MNSAILALGCIAWLTGAYHLYGRLVERKLINPDDKRKTPAHRLSDGVDFFPAKPLVLFGHHFASIAGAGPIIGPVMAVAYFGYGVSLLWILVGVVFIGAVHDYTTAMISVRNDGQSIPHLAGNTLGGMVRVLFMVFVWITLLFVIAVFLIAARKTFESDPRVVIPAFGMIPLAVVFGLLVNRLKIPLWMGTVGAICAMAGLFWLGNQFPVALHLLDSNQLSAMKGHVVQLATLSPDHASLAWLILLVLYGAAAAVLPVWILLQPRDYIGYWILATGVLAGGIGVFITGAPITAPFYMGGVSAKGPMWPMLFIMVACGAVSGFHALVSSGTTSKQLNKETDGRKVVFGAMIAEGALAVLALLCVAAGMKWGTGDQIATTTSQISSNPIGAFAAGFGLFTRPIFGSYGTVFGVVMINAFVLTTLDTSVRLARFITHELAGPKVPVLKNRFVATILVAGLALAMAATGNVGTLWKMFGASNQLVAALSLIVVSAYLIGQKRAIWLTAIPGLFMLVTTCAALVWQGWRFATTSGPGHMTLTLVSALLLGLGLVVGQKGVNVVWRQLQLEKQKGT